MKAHPDYQATDRAEAAAQDKGTLQAKIEALDAMTITRWLGHGIVSVIEDASLVDAARFIRDDLRNPRRELDDFNAEERRCLLR